MAKRQRAKVHLGWALFGEVRCQLNVNPKWVHAEWIWMSGSEQGDKSRDSHKQSHVVQVLTMKRDKQFMRCSQIEQLK